MTKKKIIFAVLTVCAAAVAFSCGRVPDNPKGEKKSSLVRIPSGSNIPSLGIAFDASYDASTDGIVPGYKILSVAISNGSIDIMGTDSTIDKWFVVDIKGSKHEAIIDLKNEDPNTYASLPPRLRQMVNYPLLVQVGETRVIDLLFRDNVNLDAFKFVRFQSGSLKKTIEIISME